MKKKLENSFYRLLFIKKTLLFFVLISFGIGVSGQTTFSGSGNWSDPARWSAGIPLIGTDAIIASGAVCIVDNNAVCNSLTLTAGAASVSLTISGTNTLNVTNGITMNFPTAGTNNTLLAVDDGTVNCASISASNSGNDNRDNKIRILTGTLTVSANLAMGNNAARNDITFTGNGTLFIGGNLVTGTFVCGTGTVNFNRTGAQTIPAYTYYNLTTSNNGVKTLAAANITVNNNLNISNTSTLQIVGNNFTVNGITNINDAGIIDDNSNNGVNTFTGLVTLNGTSSFTTTTVVTANRLIFKNGIIHNSTSNFSAGIATFNTNTQDMQLNNTGNISFASAVLVNNNLNIKGTGAGILTFSSTVTLGTNTTLTNQRETIVVGNLNGSDGTSIWINDVNSKLFYGGANAPMVTGVLDAASLGNTVDYNRSNIQNIKGVTYYNLTSSGSNTKTLSGNVTVNNTLNFNAGTIAIAANTLTLKGDLTGTPSLTGGNTSNLVIDDYTGIAPAITIPTVSILNLTLNRSAGISLSGNVTVGSGSAGNLNLSNGVLELSNSNLTINNSNAGAITGTFGSANMISTSGTGYLQKNGSAAANFQIVYPVGSNGFYTPMTITAIAALFPSYIRVRAVPAAINPTYINKYWDVSSNLASLTGVTATFNYDPAELNGASQSVDYSPDHIVWQNPPVNGSVSFGTNAFTITGTNPFNGWWTMGTATYYSYQTGNWDDPNTWTFDPSGTTGPVATFPNNNDKVVILPGRTVSLTADVSSTNLQVTINASGTLDLGTFRFSNNLTALAGQGILRLASVNFPTATTNTFINAGGGTTEYYNAIDFTLPISQTTYNHLNINTAIGVVATQLSNISLNGNLWIKQGTLRINDDVSTVKLTLTINGNTMVDAGAFISVGTGSTNSTTNPIGITGGIEPFVNYYTEFHTVIMKGDFTNEGTVKFTNLSYPVFNVFPPLGSIATSGAASVYMQGNSNNTMTLDGVTNFYNLIIDKGTDQTYTLTINPSDRTYFGLYGANTSATEGNSANPIIKKALWIRNGTLILSGYTTIASLTEGNTSSTAVNHSSDYIIPLNGSLVLNGGAVVVLNTADDYAEVNICNSVSGGTGLVNGVNQGGYSAIQLFGKLQINNGYFSARESGGIITSSIASGQLIINGGNVDTKQFLSSTGAASFAQTGGNFILRGRFTRSTTYTNMTNITSINVNNARALNSINPNYGTFNLNNTSNIFTMSGGTIRIYDVCGDGSDATNQKGFEVYSSNANYSVSGGTLDIRAMNGSGLANSPVFFITTNAPLYNVMMPYGGNAVITLQTYPLNVLNDLSLFSFTAGTFNAANLDVNVGRHFTISSLATYITGTNTTTLNGIGTQTFTVDLGSALSLNKFTINKPMGSIVNFAGTQKTINVNDDFKLFLATLNDNGNTINIAKNVYNSGLHTGTGKIVLNGNLSQTIDGNGIFNNLELFNTDASTAPVSLIANSTINGTLTFSNDKLFNIGTYNLKLNDNASVSNANSSRYIKCTGNSGDGGLTKVYASTTSFVFPIGVSNYTPSTIGFDVAPTTYGSLNVVPVNYEHPNVINTGRSLTYHWRVRSSGFNLGTAKVTYGFFYDQSNVIDNGTTITENEYVAARFDNITSTWTKGTSVDVDETNNIIGEPGLGSFLEMADYLDGDFTAGDDNPTNPFGLTTTFYSRQSGPWTDINTWSLTGHSGLAGTAVPGASDIVIIGGNDSVYLATHNTIINFGVRSCASLQIEKGSALDIGYNPGCTFTTVKTHPNGNGNFRLTTSYNSPSNYVFPFGDFSEFNNNEGTTEFYTVNATPGTIYILPTNATSYGTVILSPLGGSNIILPNIPSVSILGDLITRGQDADSWFAMTWWDASYGTIITKSVHVEGNLYIQGGSFGFIDNAAVAQDITIDGDVVVWPNAAIDVWNWMSTSTNNSMTIGGSLINNTNNTNAPYGSPSLVRFYRGANYNCFLSFIGNKSAFITNTGTTPATGSTPTTTVGYVTINKGSSKDSTLTCNIGGTLNTAFTDNWLTLQNGTFKYIRTGDFNISTITAFTIPNSAGLFINTPSNVYIANSNVDNNDLFLNGKLTLVNGNVYIGRPNGTTANNNDIEYSGGGFSEIEIQGGNLLVNGQIRRSTSSTNGVLKYTQSGGNLVINGQNSILTRAKLEILNPGSRFDMSGGTISIVRGGGTTFGDLFLRPTTSNVTGGTILFSQLPIIIWSVVDAAQTYTLDANTPLNNLTLSGKSTATARNASLGLSINPLLLKGSLTISNANSIFNSNNLNVTIGGDLSNSGTYNYGTNLTTFNGGIQNILGSTITNFYDLNVSPISSLTVNNNFTINRNLTIGNGNIVLSNYLATVKGNVVNNGSYTDNNAASGLNLNGTILQQITGTGVFGRLVLNNAAGAHLNNDINIQNDLVLTSGILDITQYQVSLGINSNIGGAPFSFSKMIKSDGVISSQGVRKFFPIVASPITFVFPVGVGLKYTPATCNITSTASVGSITVNPVNAYHSTILDVTKVLKYYWDISSSGITNFNGNLYFNYLQSDVQDNELLYVAAWLENPGIVWTKATVPDNVDETNNIITFSSINSNNLSGAYTAGIDSVIPHEVPTYQSNQNGNWSNKLIWDAVGASPPCPDGGPNGFNVIINHVVNTDVNNCIAATTTINGTLQVIAPTFGHRLGTVKGSGKLYLESGNLPAGNYNFFFDCANDGILEYGGAATYDIIAQYTSLPNLYISGTGTKKLPNTDLTICKKLVIKGSTLDQATNNPKLIILGSFERYNPGAFNRGTGANATVSFAGATPQNLVGNFNGTNSFNNLEINNSTGLTIGAGQISCMGNLLLTNGIIYTSATNKLALNTNSIVLPDGGSVTSYINGPLNKKIGAGSTFNFPLGKNSVKAHNLYLTPYTTSYWTSEFMTPNSTHNLLTAPLQVTNKIEYWDVQNYLTASASANVKIDWDPQSDLTPLMTPNGLADMCVAEYNTGTSKWDSISSKTYGDLYNGNVVTEDYMDFVLATPISFTTGAINSTKPMAYLDVASGSVCGSVGIPVKIITYILINLNFNLTYSINGITQPEVTVSSLPYTLPTSGPGDYQLISFKYNNGTATGCVSNTIIKVIDQPNDAFAGTDWSQCGVSGTTLNGNIPTAPSTGLWTIVSGVGGYIHNPSLANSYFQGILGNSYTLRWTITNGTCKSYDDVYISFPIAAERPTDFTAAPTPVCQNSSGNVYTVKNVLGNTYNWSYSGTGALINGISNPLNGVGNSVTIDFTSSATNGILSVTATNACGTSSTALTKNVTLNLAPTVTVSGDEFVCQGASVTYTASGGTGPAINNYDFKVNNISVQNGPSDEYTTNSLVSGDVITVEARTTSGCSNTGNSILVTVDNIGTWWGRTSSDWLTADNWPCKTIPTNITNVIIPAGAPNMPIINGAGAQCKDITIRNGATLTILGTNNFNIYGNLLNEGIITASSGKITLSGNYTKSISATYAHGNGTFEFNGTSVQNYTSANPTLFNNLIINNTGAGLTLNDEMQINSNANVQFTDGIINTTATNILTLDPGVTIDINLASNESFVNGFVKRNFNATTNSGTTGLFPIGANGYLRCSQVNFTTAPTSGGSLTGQFQTTLPSASDYYMGLPKSDPNDGGVFQYVDNLADEGFWEINANGGLTDGEYSITLTGNGINILNDITKVRILKRPSNGTNWEFMGSHGPTSGLSVTRTGLTGFSQFVWGSFYGVNPLPIELIKYTATCNNNQVYLEWVTAAEINNDFFTIERSSDGITFEPFAKVKGAGNSNGILIYNVIDKAPFNGITYYRLKQTDFNGRVEIYSTISSNCNQSLVAEPTVTAYPNPFNGLLLFEVNNLKESNFTLQIYDALGKVIETKEMQNMMNNNIIFIMDLSNYVNGIYYYKFTNCEIVKTGKIVKN